ncbi:MAG: dTDP-glucose 4,6-dehydratase [Candidatus Omnitrophica bacterium]|nr:dTDP-glucose 4,6-dehydratase [Candidatus Omnitrophota bacterium]
MSKTAKQKILVTGGAGFIGSEFVRQAVHKNYKVVVVDSITYAGDLSRLNDVKKHIKFYKADIGNARVMENIIKKEKPQTIIHFAAETHVDRSIQDAAPFIDANVIGTQNLVDLARKYNIKKFVHISTDEVYGESQRGRFKESAPIKPKNPYSATKAAAEFVVRAAIHTYNFPALVIRPANNYGPWQYPEKFIPVILLKALKGQKIPVYGKGEQIREWLFVADCADAIHVILKKGKLGETYNIGSYFEKKNLITAKSILKLLNKPQNQIQFVKDRPGHDFRYSVDCTKLRNLGWRPKHNFAKGIGITIDWYMNNLNWLESKKKDLEAHYKKVYKKR